MKSLNRYYVRLQRWLVGSDVYKQQFLELPNQLALTMNLFGGLVAFFYVIADIVQGQTIALFAHLSLVLISALGIILARNNRLELAKVIILVMFNVFCFLAVAAESYETYSHLYFFTTAITAFVIFDHRKLYLSVLLALFAFGLYLLSTLTQFSVLPQFNLSYSSTRTFFVVNVLLFISITSVMISLYVRMIHKRNEEIRKKNKQLRQKNSELDHFLYSTSHDLRSPLASVQGLLTLAKLSDDKQELDQYHDLMRNRINRMDTFIRDIIDVIKNSRLPVHNEDISLKELIDQVFTDLSQHPGMERIQLINSIAGDLVVCTDLRRITTVMHNLLSNAIKYSDPRKTHSFIKVTAKEKPGSMTMMIEDNGIGISPEHMEKIFQMFYRASEHSSGAGLGLYIASETVRMLEGSIQVDSKHGEGTCFLITIPTKSSSKTLSNKNIKQLEPVLENED